MLQLKLGAWRLVNDTTDHYWPILRCYTWRGTRSRPGTCSTAHRSNRTDHWDGLILDKSAVAVGQLSPLSSRKKWQRIDCRQAIHYVCIACRQSLPFCYNRPVNCWTQPWRASHCRFCCLVGRERGRGGERDGEGVRWKREEQESGGENGRGNGEGGRVKRDGRGRVG